MLLTFRYLFGAVFLARILTVALAEDAANRQRPDCITESGVLQWQGKPFFPIGIYEVDPTPAEYRLMAKNGFNMIQGMFPGDLQAFMKSLDWALEAGLAVDVPLYVTERVTENLENSLSTIRAARRHPAVLCWKILDEPDSDRNESARDEVPGGFSAIKAVFPEQPLELTLCQDQSLGYWSKFCDIVQIDRYPLPDKPLTEVYDFCRKAVAAKASWQTLIFVVQCGWTPDLKTQPSFDQARAMVYLALIGGAKGISWYSRQEVERSTGRRVWDLTRSPLWPRMKEINREVQSLALPVLLGEHVAGIKTEPSLYISAKRWQEKLYLLICNPANSPMEASLSLPDGVRLESVKGIGFKGHVSADNTGIRMLLEPVDSGTVIAEIGPASGSGRDRAPLELALPPLERFRQTRLCEADPSEFNNRLNIEDGMKSGRSGQHQ